MGARDYQGFDRSATVGQRADRPNGEGAPCPTKPLSHWARIIPNCASRCAEICARYPGTYWSDLEDQEAYPTEFVNELTQRRFPRRA